MLDWLSHRGICDPPRKLSPEERGKLGSLFLSWKTLAAAYDAGKMSHYRYMEEIEALTKEVDKWGLRRHFMLRVATTPVPRALTERQNAPSHPGHEYDEEEVA